MPKKETRRDSSVVAGCQMRRAVKLTGLDNKAQNDAYLHIEKL